MWGLYSHECEYRKICFRNYFWNMYSYFGPCPLYWYSACICTSLVPIHKNIFGELFSVQIHAAHVFTPGRIQENIPGDYLCIGFVPGGNYLHSPFWISVLHSWKSPKLFKSVIFPQRVSHSQCALFAPVVSVRPQEFTKIILTPRKIWGINYFGIYFLLLHLYSYFLKSSCNLQNSHRASEFLEFKSLGMLLGWMMGSIRATQSYHVLLSVISIRVLCPKRTCVRGAAGLGMWIFWRASSCWDRSSCFVTGLSRT